jgi:hypothetical protein
MQVRLQADHNDAGPVYGGIAMASPPKEHEPRHYHFEYLIEALALPMALVLSALGAALWCFLVRWS